MRNAAFIACLVLALGAGDAFARGSSGRSGGGGVAPRGIVPPRLRRPSADGFQRMRSPANRARIQRPATTQSRGTTPTRRVVPRSQLTRTPRTDIRGGISRSSGSRSDVARGDASRIGRRAGTIDRTGGRVLPQRTRGTSTSEYLTRRRGGSSITRDVRSGDVRSGDIRAGGRAFRHDGSRATTGWRQPTVAPGYADRFPCTGGSPVRGDCRWYTPCYSRYRNCYWGFYYPCTYAYAYVPFGFYGTGASIYIDVGGRVADDYAIERYVEREPSAEEEAEVQAPAGSAAAERYMREATELFRKKDYPEAARRFRLAAIAAPDSAGPLFALGQALVALENYPYAAKVIRQAIDMEPELLREGGDLGSVYADREEFHRVRVQVAQRIADRPDDVHALFLLGIAQYFSGDPAARDTFGKLLAADSGDRIARSLAEASAERFRKADELPPIEVGGSK